MQRALSLFLVSLAATLVACVTINVYFPAAAAERAADRIIDDVWGAARPERPPETPPESSGNGGDASPATMLLDFFIPPAAAQARPDLDVSSPEIRRITAAMEARHTQLLPHYESGAVGLTGNGDVTVRDAAQVPLAQRNAVRGLVNEENAERAALYRQIAVANDQPQWEGEIRSVFAQRWVARARSGWWYQDEGGNWVQK